VPSSRVDAVSYLRVRNELTMPLSKFLTRGKWTASNGDGLNTLCLFLIAGLSDEGV
jgi:hypothetical protein